MGEYESELNKVKAEAEALEPIDLDDEVYEAWNCCDGTDAECVWCDGLGLVPHTCGPGWPD